MKKPVIFIGCASKIDISTESTDHVPALKFEVAYFKNLRPRNELARFIIHLCDVNVSIGIDIEKTKYDGISTDLFGASSVFDVKVQDRRGNELIIPNAKISERLRVTHRIPRKLKKSLKNKHGVYWVQHHPNTETVVTINSQN
jgi:hypothetical protein|nr:MAG TPA: hypothetical protein [Caudoviricetes sp.]